MELVIYGLLEAVVFLIIASLILSGAFAKYSPNVQSFFNSVCAWPLWVTKLAGAIMLITAVGHLVNAFV